MIDINQVSHLIIIYSGRGELKRTLTYVTTVFFIVIYYAYNFEFSLSFNFRWSVFHIRHSKTVLTSHLQKRPFKTTHITALPRQLRGAAVDDAANRLLQHRNSTCLLRCPSCDKAPKASPIILRHRASTPAPQ